MLMIQEYEVESSADKFLIVTEIFALNFELTFSYRTMRALDHAKSIDYGHEKLARH
jgi:hypothetical protein